MAKLGQVAFMGMSGFGGAMAYNNKDLVDDFMRDGTRGIVHNLTSPSGRSASGGTNPQLETMVSRLANQVDSLAVNQRNSHGILVQTSQPSTVLGMEVWKLAAVAGTGGMIYMKIKGYEIKDLVYVSKKHFNTVTDSLRQQFDVLEEAVNNVKQELLVQIGLVEKKVDEARESIEGKIEAEMEKVDGQMTDLGANINRVGLAVDENKAQVGAIGTDISLVKGDISAIGSELSSLQDNIDRQGKGISLLVKFVCKTQGTSSPDLLEELEDYTNDKSDNNTRRMSLPPPASRAHSQPMIRKKTTGLAGLTPFNMQAV